MLYSKVDISICKVYIINLLISLRLFKKVIQTFIYKIMLVILKYLQHKPCIINVLPIHKKII